MTPPLYSLIDWFSGKFSIALLSHWLGVRASPHSQEISRGHHLASSHTNHPADQLRGVVGFKFILPHSHAWKREKLEGI
jgi:hypothetical protein